MDAVETYGVACGEFLLSADDSSATLGLVDRSLSSHDGLALRRASAGLASDLSNGVPIVRHGDGVLGCVTSGSVVVSAGSLVLCA